MDRKIKDAYRVGEAGEIQSGGGITEKGMDEGLKASKDEGNIKGRVNMWAGENMEAWMRRGKSRDGKGHTNMYVSLKGAFIFIHCRKH